MTTGKKREAFGYLGPRGTNPRRVGRPFIYKNLVMFEHEQNRPSAMVSCIHPAIAAGKGRLFGAGICHECVMMIQREAAEIQQAMKKEGFEGVLE